VLDDELVRPARRAIGQHKVRCGEQPVRAPAVDRPARYAVPIRERGLAMESLVGVFLTLTPSHVSPPPLIVGGWQTWRRSRQGLNGGLLTFYFAVLNPRPTKPFQGRKGGDLGNFLRQIGQQQLERINQRAALSA